ncbi:MAG: M23 family metallopeptidase [Candidatus Marinimicrobia bacterium]|nr:M23 family metallopeptidase [Candidatus Neomarinimicrobiota bacterium]
MTGLKPSKKTPDSLKRFLFLLLAVLNACTAPMLDSPGPEKESTAVIPALHFSIDSLTASIITNYELANLDSLTILANQPVSLGTLIDRVQPGLHDSSKVMYAEVISAKISNHKLMRTLSNLDKSGNQIILTYAVDTSYIMPEIRHILAKTVQTLPLEPLFDRGGLIPDFSIIVPATALILPCQGLNIPKKATRLPNAPRTYRSGIHRGIDFFSDWGTSIQAVAKGLIIRSDLNYKEIPADFRVNILSRAAKLDRTPSDIFNSILLGKAVFIDHGFDLFPGYRTITIYAHLSHINPNVKAGYRIKAGEVFAKSGNTGTRPSTLGTRDESHLHWELILQDEKGEYYFGQNLPYEKLYPALNSLFRN